MPAVARDGVLRHRRLLARQRLGAIAIVGGHSDETTSNLPLSPKKVSLKREWLGGDLNSRPWGYESHALTS